MPTIEQQLHTWANPVRLQKDVDTYDYVEGLFQGCQFNGSRDFEIYLQGSVANCTNIRADGDIDIVFQHSGIFYYSYNYGDYNSPSSYNSTQLRDGIKSVLKGYNIKYQDKDKCIKLNLKGEGWQDVDLIPCFLYKFHLNRFNYLEGIRMETLNGNAIINYPKLHQTNGERKNDRAPDYKSIVRIFKNIKKRLVEEGWCEEKLAPSYFIECLLYNVPDEAFNENTYTSELNNCFSCLRGRSLGHYKCQNEIDDLFGNESTQWDESSCQVFLDKAWSYLTQ